MRTRTSWSSRFKEYDLAKEYYRRATRHAPTLAEAHIGLAGILESKFDRYDEARRHLETALRHHPQMADAHFQYGYLVSRYFNEHELARKHFIEGLKITPETAEGHCHYAFLLEEYLHEYNSARLHYEAALKYDPYHKDTLFHFANFYDNRIGNYRKAAELYQRALSVDDSFADAHLHLAYILETEMGEHEKARPHYERCLELNPKSYEAHCLLGALLTEHFQDHQGALNHYLEGLVINDKFSDALWNIALLLDEKLKKPGEALQYFEKCAEVNSDDEYRYWYGRCCEKTNQLVLAMECYEKCIKFADGAQRLSQLKHKVVDLASDDKWDQAAQMKIRGLVWDGAVPDLYKFAEEYTRTRDSSNAGSTKLSDDKVVTAFGRIQGTMRAVHDAASKALLVELPSSITELVVSFAVPFNVETLYEPLKMLPDVTAPSLSRPSPTASQPNFLSTLLSSIVNGHRFSGNGSRPGDAK